ncbi:MAG TPA: AAA family ATPase [Acidimicrobiales bacterium]|nr:AAA family ATPase [Acidimicrobiales bacterium]
MATKIGLMAQELSRQNPWWRDARWASLDPDLVDTAATGLHYESKALTHLVQGCVYILRGPRRVGKTVTLKQQIRDVIDEGTPPTSIVRVACDGWSAKELRTVVQNAALPPLPDGIDRVWFFDEISSVSGDWDQQIKWLRDNDPAFRAATVVLTGSNVTALTSAAGTLAGRRGRDSEVDRVLLPIGFKTFVALATDDPAPVSTIDASELRSEKARTAFGSLLPWLDELVRLWEIYLQYGGFPRSVAAAAQGKPIPADFVEDVFNVIAGDAFKSSRLNVAAEMALLERLWSSMASPLNFSNVGADLGMSDETVARHVRYLEDSYLLWRCPQRAENAWVARERAQDKIYAIDPLVARLPYLRNPFRSDIDPTILTEMQIGMAVRRRLASTNPTALNDDFLFYYRTPTRKEVDFVSRDFAGAALEGKYCESGSWHAHAATVNASEWNGLMCTRNVLDLDTDSAWAVPAGILAYCLDT